MQGAFVHFIWKATEGCAHALHLSCKFDLAAAAGLRPVKGRSLGPEVQENSAGNILGVRFVGMRCKFVVKIENSAIQRAHQNNCYIKVFWLIFRMF